MGAGVAPRSTGEGRGPAANDGYARAVFDAILYLLRTGCQWRQLPADFPPWPTVHGYFRCWRIAGFWTRSAPCTLPTLIILLPVMGAVAALVLADVGQPVIFRQVRPGRHMRPFKLYKFRTMGDAYDG